MATKRVGDEQLQALFHDVPLPISGCRCRRCQALRDCQAYREALRKWPCDECKGTGKEMAHFRQRKCVVCHGTGLHPTAREVLGDSP